MGRLIVAEDKVHLLQRPAHGLRDEEVDPDQCEQAEYGKEDLEVC